jgi:Hydrazine synthase alpha subunit middle domain
LWSLNPTSGDLKLLNHAPSGNFTPFLDSFGRVVFTQWDHLQRDQQLGNDNDQCNGPNYGLFNFADETSSAAKLNDCTEVFPEPHGNGSVVPGTNYRSHRINLFTPWTVLEDGSEGELLNHLGRHEIGGYFQESFVDDPNLTDMTGQKMEHFLHIKENPLEPGTYFATDAPEFGTHSGGDLVALASPPSLNPDLARVQRLTSGNSGQYRDPLPLANGTLIAAHTPTNAGEGGGGAFSTLYQFRLKTLVKSGQTYTAGPALTPGNGLEAKISYGGLNFTGALWELNPVEVRARARPARRTVSLPAPETRVLERVGVNLSALQVYLEQNNLALIVSRNVTARDRADRQQPFNLRVPGGMESIAKAGKVYDVTHLQLFQADQLRGLGGINSPRPGRRVLAQALHDPKAVAANKPVTTGPAGSVVIGKDGSVAAFVPARRALSWQLTDAQGKAVVRERFWVTFQPGEVRVCAACHGINTTDQLNRPAPVTEPEALKDLLEYWKNR